MAAGDEADLLIGCRMMTADKKLIRYDDDSSYMDEFRAGAGLFSNPRRRSSSCIIGLVKVSLKAMDNGMKENDEHSIWAPQIGGE